MANIIPMAGLGSRFVKEGYLLPKPLISVSGKTMIERVIESLPASDKWIFIVREQHVKEHGIDSFLKSLVPGAIVDIEENPSGQATSCMRALEYLEENDELLVASCDNSFLYDAGAFEKQKQQPGNDCIVWTFTKDKLLAEKPEAWGWILTEEDKKTIADVSIKTPVSPDPFNDHAVVATFYFKRAAQMRAAGNLMVQENFRINGEFYLDAMPIFYKKLGMSSALFDVNLYVGWGKPSDLHAYEEKEYRFAHMGEKGGLDERWMRFFSGLAKA